MRRGLMAPLGKKTELRNEEIRFDIQVNFETSSKNCKDVVKTF